MLRCRIVNSLNSSKRKLCTGWLKSYRIGTRGYVKSAEGHFKDRLDNYRRRTGIPGYGADPVDDATRYVLLRRVPEEVYESQLLPNVPNAAGFTAVTSKKHAIDEGQVSVVIEFQSPEKARRWRSSLSADFREQSQLLREREARQTGKRNVHWIRLDKFREETRMSTIGMAVSSIVNPLHIFFDRDDSGKFAIVRLESSSAVELAHHALNEMYIDGRMVLCTKDSENYNAQKGKSQPAAEVQNKTENKGYHEEVRTSADAA
ncbi:hypothetical protein NDN08_005716 [Rhodosorus marinus]|uniref:RRM domain-containing protein n=1 Tax=Rhodosorus marinus TaxID=101924 RepID=A0AAV8V4K9_9RHOD|nr:hypothetical protein NDN08_005716 [Rhodosorus marinus]